MIRAQAIVYRGNKLLMVKHRLDGAEYWCLPGGGVEPGETPAITVVRELEEECGVTGEVIRQTGLFHEGFDVENITFLVDIGAQHPHMGSDPEFDRAGQILVDMQWLALSEICERDRAYLWAAGLMDVLPFLEELSRWGDDISYPSLQNEV